MTKKELIEEIKTLDNDLLAWFSPSDLNEMGVRFSTTEQLLNNGTLTYDGGDDLYVGKRTYADRY